ncbi:S8 family serine peptidase [Streptomyces marispadix]|uniref:S8 family serine peptidase n=1 Tax=Streptomyces marispadix TaxID=2922868 RepID=A0ABS9T354_9ACTN|nr:S8 family serine peptidase [Streptomyces marispadix]MCH6162952.1 S8 family serine peptidase [Streptomyces marispadix]
MSLRRALHLVGTGALTGALLLGSAPAASADDIRDRQWALDFFAGEDIWEHATGKGVTVAVVDTGVDSEQPDLKGSVLRGKDYTQGKGTRDNGRHGTAMAGLIAAHGHGPGGKSGMKGLAPGAKIMPLTTEIGSTNSFQSQGIRYAVDHGADVINLSYAGPLIPGDEQAVRYAISKDVVVVAGSGNSPGKHKEYPAGYPGVLSVGGLGRDGTLWESSSWGSNVSLVAPAEKNVTPDKKYESGYGFTSGTSDASAYVSAAAALVREKHPDLTAGQVINRLIKTAKPLTDAKGNAPKLPDEKFGYGVVRPYRAVTNDIPAGPKAGPLAQSGSSDSSAGDAASDSGSSSDDSSGWMFALGPPVVLFGLIFLVLVGVAVLVVVLVKRKDSRDRVSDPWASGGGPSVPPQQPGQQVQAPTGQFGGPPNSPPPPPNQPPSR